MAATEPYRPSNGTEGDGFYHQWCAGCEKEKGKRFCSILSRAYAHQIGERGYPKEWVRDDDGPRCTAFVPIGPPQPPRPRNAHKPLPGQGTLFGKEVSDAGRGQV